jgi:hypothetical protein
MSLSLGGKCSSKSNTYVLGVLWFFVLHNLEPVLVNINSAFYKIKARFRVLSKKCHLVDSLGVVFPANIGQIMR